MATAHRSSPPRKSSPNQQALIRLQNLWMYTAAGFETALTGAMTSWLAIYFNSPWELPFVAGAIAVVVYIALAKRHTTRISSIAAEHIDSVVQHKARKESLRSRLAQPAASLFWRGVACGVVAPVVWAGMLLLFDLKWSCRGILMVSVFSFLSTVAFNFSMLRRFDRMAGAIDLLLSHEPTWGAEGASSEPLDWFDRFFRVGPNVRLRKLIDRFWSRDYAPVMALAVSIFVAGLYFDRAEAMPLFWAMCVLTVVLGYAVSATSRISVPTIALYFVEWLKHMGSGEEGADHVRLHHLQFPSRSLVSWVRRRYPAAGEYLADGIATMRGGAIVLLFEAMSFRPPALVDLHLKNSADFIGFMAHAIRSPIEKRIANIRDPQQLQRWLRILVWSVNGMQAMAEKLLGSARPLDEKVDWSSDGILDERGRREPVHRTLEEAFSSSGASVTIELGFGDRYPVVTPTLMGVIVELLVNVRGQGRQDARLRLLASPSDTTVAIEQTCQCSPADAVRLARRLVELLPDGPLDQTPTWSEYHGEIKGTVMLVKSLELLATKATEASWRWVFHTPTGPREFVIRARGRGGWTSLLPLDNERQFREMGALDMLTHPCELRIELTAIRGLLETRM